MNIRSLAVAAAMAAAMTGLAAGCTSSSSAPHVSPSVSAAAHAAEQRGIVVLEKCTPNGKAVFGAIINKTATLKTYHQVYKFFKVPANRATAWACASKQPGAASVPGTSPKTAMENCFAGSAALTTALHHPFHAVHQIALTAKALVTAAAICIGNNA